MGGLRGRRPRSAHRLALAPACWGIHEAGDWGHQIDAERVLSECAAVGEGAITAGPPGFLPDRSDHARKLLRRNRLQVVAGQVQAILHHHETRGPELAHIDGHAHWLAAIGGETLVLSAIPEREAGSTRPDELSNAQWAHLLHLIGSVEHVCARHRLKLAVQPRFGSTIQGPKVARVTEALRRSDYRGWYTLEQDTRLATTDDRPLGQISRSLEFVLPLLS